MKRFTVTYEIVTPESAEHADVAERGFIAPGDWHQQERESMSLRDAVKLVGICEDSGYWLTECDGRDNYQTGANERRSLHMPDDISGASYRRIARIFGAAK